MANEAIGASTESTPSKSSAPTSTGWRWFKRLVVLGAASITALLVVANVVVAWRGNNRVFTDIVDVTEWANEADGPVDAVIVPGAAIYVMGYPSTLIARRVEAAAQLYDVGVVEHVLVSGDNSTVDYDEATALRRLVHLEGVPLADITVDYAGFSTWDSCRRAHEIFGVKRAVFVTQQRYANRAAALCRSAGIDSAVYAQPDGRAPTQQRRIWDRVRERLAAVKATYEIVVKPDPRFLGDFEGLPGSERPANPDPALGEI